jgi:hypothetical protein
MKHKIVALLTGALLLSGCASFQPSVAIHPIASNQPTYIDMDASRRGVIIIPRPDNKGYFVCSEPSPDVAVATITRILAEVKLSNPNIDAKTEMEFRTAIIELTKRSQTILFLRESMFRICEQSINQNLSAEQVMKLHELAILTALKLAEAELAKNQADLAKQLADPKVRELWQQVNNQVLTPAPSK